MMNMNERNEVKNNGEFYTSRFLDVMDRQAIQLYLGLGYTREDVAKKLHLTLEELDSELKLGTMVIDGYENRQKQPCGRKAKYMAWRADINIKEMTGEKFVISKRHLDEDVAKTW